ncbi:hypothetical protein B0T21DRAFT_14421 [Apiosordaria backusii]|uniref:Uncharacterized protein n=1 Tax=Apiosordaria backusii TaxID=314023 RepID=A0AA40EYQ3_9PEZI|nr:hypothetical protein B0T21DRAFT_14421 [Apiosordaria backusii]
MKGRPVDQLVYEYMFPKPRQSDPQNFTQLLQRYLVLEVRQEVHSFYGHLDTPEAKYPGLDYTNRIHRIRLSRWQWHRRLFRAFDGLRLTYAEIQGLTKWEGTRWAKERFEKEQGTTIRDTTADGFPDWVEPEHRPAGYFRRASEETDETVASPEDEEMDEESDGELESVGVALNERLRERVALRNISGDNSMPLDEEWENWLKNAIESGELHVADQIARFPGPHPALTADDVFPPRMMAAARAGHWEGIPDFVHNIIRQTIDAEQRPPQAQPTTAPSRPSVRYHNGRGSLARVAVYGPEIRHSRSDVRLHRTAQQGA